jgi:hypothetical protein
MLVCKPRIVKFVVSIAFSFLILSLRDWRICLLLVIIPVVYVSNNQSFFRHLYSSLPILGIRSFKFISKTAIFLYPFEVHGQQKPELDCLNRCMDLTKKGAFVFFFTEGTRIKDGKLGTFKVSPHQNSFNLLGLI